MTNNNDWSNVLKKADEAAEAIKQQSYTPKEIVDKTSQMLASVSYDPSPSAEGVAKERLEHLLASVTTTTLDELRELRDEIDNLMRIVQTRHDILLSACHEHVGYSSSTIAAKEIIKENIVKIGGDFKNGIDPVPKTVTVTENK